VSDKITRLGAALAFYTTVAVAPLLLLAVAVARFFFEEDSARRRILGEIDQLLGPSASVALNNVQATGGHAPSSAAWLGMVTLILGGCGVFVHLQDALNSIWRAPAHTNETWPAVIKRRLFSFGTVLATGFVMLVSLTLSAAITWLGENASRWARLPTAAWEFANFALSFGVIALLFAVLFKLLPDISIRWRDVWTGAGVTALLFVAGKTVLGIYLARSAVTSAFGAAGSIIALLLWCYYAGQILFIGAEFTRVHAGTRGGRIPLPPETPLA
jgi:membrane protein